MSTYTDLHNRVKENITVDYNNRVTPQRVRFFNEQNEYWGTFRGHVSAENININGGSLSGVTLTDTILNGSVALPDGIDLHKVLQQVKQISTDLINTSQVLDQEIADRENAIEQEKDSRISADMNEASSRQLKDSGLSGEIAQTNKDLVREISTLNIVLTHQDADISSALDMQDRSLCVDLQQEMHARIDNDNYLSDAIVDSRADFGREVFDRTRADEKLELSIRTEAANSQLRDDKLCTALSIHIADNEEQFNTLSIRIAEAIEHDRHYVINTGSNTAKTTDCWPYSSKDYAINVYNPVVNDGAVYFMAPNGERHEVGALYKINHDNLYPFTFKTLDGISHPGVASALVNNWSYGFSETQKSQRTELNGYNITFNDLVASGVLSDFTFTVAPTLPQFHKVVLDGLMVGKVTDAYLSDYNENVISGIMWIDTTDSELATFNKFRCVSFNNTDLSVCNKMTERMTYLGFNKFKFEKNIDRAEFIGLYDNLNDEHYQFARIYDSYNSIPGIVSDDIGVTDINVRLGTPWSQLINLNRDAGFKNIVEEDVKFGDIYYNTVLSANVNELSAKFDLVKVSELYKYNFNGIDDEGHEFTAGYVVPRVFNKTIKESALDFAEVSANIADIMWVNAFKKTYVLTKTSLETLWTAEDTDAEGNSLNIKFNGMTLFVKVTSGTDGTIIRQEFSVLVNEPEVFNPDTCHEHVYTTAYVDISQYKEVYETPEATYNITMNAAVESEAFPRYELNIDTAVTDLLKIQVPERTSDDISREFKVLINPNSQVDKLIELEFVDKDGKHVDITNNRHYKVFVPTNKWSLLQLNEINDNIFFVKDLDDNEDMHDIEFLSNAISVETENRIANDNFLSDTMELSVSELQSQILSNDADIADIYDRIRGGINYKGKIYGEIRDTSENIVEISAISNLFVWNTHHYSVNGYTEDTVLSNGYMYIMQTLSGSTKYKFNIEGVDIEDRDYVIINCRGTDPNCNGKAIKYLTSADVDIIDAEDADVIHRPELYAVSSDLQAQIISNDNDIEFLSNEVSTIHWIELSGFHFLSGEIDRLCTEISDEVVLSATNLQGQVISNDNDIDYLSANVKFLLSVDHETVNYKGTLPWLSNLEDPVSHADLGYNYLSTFILQDMGIHAPYRLKLGDMFKLSAEQECLRDAVHNACWFGANDYFIVNRDIMVSDVTSADIDIIRDAQLEVEKLSSIMYLSVENLQSQIISNDNDIEYISCEVSCNDNDIKFLSGQHDWLSGQISNVTDLSVENLQKQIISNDNDIEFLSGQHDWLSGEISNVMDLSVKNLQDQVISNDNDIEFLSNDLSILEYQHYNKTLSNDIELKHTYYDHEGHEVSISAEVDQLVLVDEVTFDRYRLTIRNGALNINKLDNLIPPTA